jgi:transcriptional regulator with GAF, ATPase, and Fis domain
VLLYAPNFHQLPSAFPFTSDVITLGRELTCDVPIPEQAVSREHARIRRTPEGTYRLLDLGSRNGTMVRGQFITEVELEANMELRIGDAIFKFVPEGAERYVDHRLDGARAPGQPAATDLVGGAQMTQIATELERLGPTELSCVVLGETGTGKEVVARALHRLSQRKGALQAINCAAIPASLLESELFGYRRGAFSGADRDKPGLVKLADGGTLFLDEIGDMPLEAQAKLLRVLQSREVFPLGATTPERVDLRVVCATHRNLYEAVRDGRFRGDLFARLNEHTVRLPPLRERKEDLYQLAVHFGARYGHGALRFTFSFAVAMLHYDWPFNVRELESCIKRAVALTRGDVIDTQHLPDAITANMAGYGDRSVRQAQRPSNVPSQGPPASAAPASDADASRRAAPTEAELRLLLERHKGNVAAIGRELGKERMQIHRWLKRYGIDLDAYRD